MVIEIKGDTEIYYRKEGERQKIHRDRKENLHKKAKKVWIVNKVKERCVEITCNVVWAKDYVHAGIMRQYRIGSW